MNTALRQLRLSLPLLACGAGATVRTGPPSLQPFVRSQHTEAAPDVYSLAPPQPGSAKPGQLAQWQVEHFFRKGYVLVPNFFSPDELQPAIAGVEQCVDILAEKLYSAGKIADKCNSAGFYHRLTLIEQQFKGAAVLLHKMGYLPPALRQLWGHVRLLNAVEQFIGPNIAGHPVWNLRTKTPRNEQTTVPWHQDNAYLDPIALHVLIVTAWIPLVDTNTHNGCLQVVSGGGRMGKTATHTCCAGDTWYVDLAEEKMEEELNVDMGRDVVTCPVPLGGVLFLNNCIPHRSLENHSEQVRWSLDLRWQDPNRPNGFYGLKDNIVMRSESDRGYQPHWEEFVAVSRDELQTKEIGYCGDEFDTTIHGPWMRRWNITHHNHHTRTLTNSNSSSWHGYKA